MNDPFVIVAFGIIAVVVLTLLWFRPRALVIATLLAILFVRTLTHLSSAAAVDYLEDALVVVTVVRAAAAALQRGRMVAFPGILLLALFAAAGIISGLATEEVSYGTLGAGTYLALKGIAFGWAVAQFDWPLDSVKRMLRPAAWLFLVILILGVVSIVLPAQWAAIFSQSGLPNVRYGFPSALGPFIHPFDLAFTASMGAAAAAAYYATVRRSRKILALAITGAVVTFMTFRRKDLVGLIAAFAITEVRQGRVGPWIVAAFALPGLLLVFGETLFSEAQNLFSAYFADGSEEARTRLTMGSFSVAAAHWPLGAGFGRYGSRTAAVDYSPEYIALGFPQMHGLGMGEYGFFLTDTSWPALVGETGFIGAALFLLALVTFALSARRLSTNATSSLDRFVGTVALAWLTLTVFQSAGSAVFTSPPMFGFIFFVMGLVAARTHANAQNPGQQTPHFDRAV